MPWDEVVGGSVLVACQTGPWFCENTLVLSVCRSFEDQIRSRVGLGPFSCDYWGLVLALLVLRRNVQNNHDFHGVVPLTRPSTVCIWRSTTFESFAVTMLTSASWQDVTWCRFSVGRGKPVSALFERPVQALWQPQNHTLGKFGGCTSHFDSQSGWIVMRCTWDQHSSFPLLYISSRAIRDHFRSSSDWIQSRFFYLWRRQIIQQCSFVKAALWTWYGRGFSKFVQQRRWAHFAATFSFHYLFSYLLILSFFY